MTGGPIGFSTDIAGCPQDEKEILKKHVEQFKLDRDFYKTANFDSDIFNLYGDFNNTVQLNVIAHAN